MFARLWVASCGFDGDPYPVDVHFRPGMKVFRNYLGLACSCIVTGGRCEEASAESAWNPKFPDQHDCGRGDQIIRGTFLLEDIRDRIGAIGRWNRLVIMLELTQVANDRLNPLTIRGRLPRLLFGGAEPIV